MLEAAKFYVEHGFNIIPLKPKSKENLIPRWRELQKRRLHPVQLEAIFKSHPDANIGLICGAISGNFFVLDFDSDEAFHRFIDNVYNRMANEGILPQTPVSKWTWIARTSKGYHVYLRAEEPVRTFKPCPDIDVKGEGGFVVAPPSIHPSGRRYEPISGFWLDETEIPRLDMDTVNTMFRLIEESCGGNRKTTATLTGVGGRVLSEDEVMDIVELLRPFYVKGYRNNLLFALSGFMFKNGVSPESIMRVIEALSAGDEEQEKRVSDIRYWLTRMVRMPRESITGERGLEDVMLDVESKVLGLDGSLTRATLVELKRLVKRSFKVYSIVLETDNEGWSKKMVIYPEKIVFEYRSGKRRIIGEPGILSVEPTVFTGITPELRGVRVRTGDGRLYVGDVESVSATVAGELSLERRHDRIIMNAVKRLALKGSPSRTFYSPGVWLVDGEPVLVSRGEYSAPWKPSVEWNPPTTPVGDVDGARMSLHRLINSYGRPDKAVFILSFAIASVYAHFFRSKYGYFPGLVVYGPRETGKGVLADTIRLLFSIPPENTPRTKYEFQRALTAITLPLIIEELRFTDDPRNQALIEMIHEMATNTFIREVRAGQYTGHYYNIRGLIAMTNDSPSGGADMRDKLVPLGLSQDEGVKVESARGHTPRTMPPDVAEGVRWLGVEMIKRYGARAASMEGPVSRELLLRRWVEMAREVMVEVLGVELPGLDAVWDEVFNGTDEDGEDPVELARLFVHTIREMEATGEVEIVEMETGDGMIELLREDKIVFNPSKKCYYVPSHIRVIISNQVSRKAGIRRLGRRRLLQYDGFTTVYHENMRYCIICPEQ